MTDDTKTALSGRRAALVTGGGRGIGAAISARLAGAGMDVALTYRRDAGAATATVEAIGNEGGTAIGIQSDVTSIDDNRRAVDTALEAFGRLDIVVSNAGIASRGRSVADTPPDELAAVMATHALGPHSLLSLAVPHLRKQDRSDVVVISSVAVLSHIPNGAPYTMAKVALESLALTLANEERANGMRVNIVAAGLVDTDMGRRLVKGAAGIEDIRELDTVMPFGRVATPDDVAGAVLFFVSDDASYITGEKLNVHGGGQRWR